MRFHLEIFPSDLVYCYCPSCGAKHTLKMELVVVSKNKPIKLSKEEWNRIAEYIVDNSCGCYYSTFNGDSLQSAINR
jgi:hypothetical protein